MVDGRPKGKQYRELYVPRGDPQQDGECFRRRLLALLESNDIPTLKQLYLQTLFTRLGIPEQYLSQQVQKAPIERLLSFITVIYEHLQERAQEYTQNHYGRSERNDALRLFIPHIAEILAQERMAYEIDDQGGIHPLMDAEFQRNRQSTLKSLSSSRYANVHHSFEAAFKRLTVANFDTKAAIRDVF